MLPAVLNSFDKMKANMTKTVSMILRHAYHSISSKSEKQMHPLVYAFIIYLFLPSCPLLPHAHPCTTSSTSSIVVQNIFGLAAHLKNKIYKPEIKPK
jgi:hypothetical protein